MSQQREQTGRFLSPQQDKSGNLHMHETPDRKHENIVD